MGPGPGAVERVLGRRDRLGPFRVARAGLEKRLIRIEKTLVGHNTTLRDLYRRIRPLLLPPEAPPKPRIGFRRDE